ncbi:MAG TPA: NADH-quinone oxidoreductase subunit NuoB [Mycobacteriales bacterium]|nr:NADH-quinone oxidoreductase subunit NuoB [Mycobacteriales bacterium]
MTPLRLTVDALHRYRLTIFDVGLACCAVEFVAATLGSGALASSGLAAVATTPHDADVLVVSGTVTDKLAPAVRQLYDDMPPSSYVISFGSCSNSGGPYWDSYCVTKGVNQLLPVDVFVPGCPPRPEALLHALLRLPARTPVPA